MPQLRVVGLIPAKGHSEGVPYKNMRLLYGRPLIWYTIQAALAANLDAIYVSTDDPKIALFARSQDTRVGTIGRPKDLARGEDGSMIRTVQHAVEKKGLDEYDALMLLQPTTPLRTVEQINEAIELLKEDDNGDSTVGFVSVEGNHPARMRVSGRDGYMHHLEGWTESPGQSRQVLDPVFIRSGSIYLTRLQTLLSGSFEGDHCIPLIIDESKHCNIDTEADFARAEHMIAEREGKILKGEFACRGTRYTRSIQSHEMTS